MENEKLLEHEKSHLGEHLYMLLSFVLSLGSTSSKLEPLLDRLSAEASYALVGGRPLATEAELPGSLGLLGKCEALERKTVTFENIVCVLNREVEKVSLVAEAASRQHQLDQEKIEALSAKVGQGFVARVQGAFRAGLGVFRSSSPTSWPGGSRRGRVVAVARFPVPGFSFSTLGPQGFSCPPPRKALDRHCKPVFCPPGPGAAAGEERCREGPGPGRDGACHPGDGGGLLRRRLHLEDYRLRQEAAGGSCRALSGHLLPR